MFGTVARMTVQPGQDKAFLTVGGQWTAERGEATGQIAEIIFKLENEPDTYLVVAVFRDRDTYRANAANPETDRWYRRVRATLASDPVWQDGDVIHSALPGGIEGRRAPGQAAPS